MWPDVVIIGGGIIGVCCAYYLAGEGAQVQLLERHYIASGASSACEGNILFEATRPGLELALTKASALLWDSFPSEFHQAIEYCKPASLVIAAGEDAEDALGQVKHTYEDEDIHGRFLGRDDLRALEPNLADDVTSAVCFAGYNAHLQPMLATMLLARAAAARGVVIHTFTEVTDIQLSRSRGVEAVGTTAGRIPTRAVVNAAGAWSGTVARMVGINVPVSPRRGHIVVTEPVAGLVRHLITEASYIRTVEESDTTKANVCTIIETTASGNLLLGSSRDTLAGFDRAVNLDIIEAIVTRSIRFFPCLARVCAIHSYAGLRPTTPDLHPIVGETEAVPGFYVASGHEGAGITNGPLTGKLISQMIAGKKVNFPPEYLSQLSPSRFAN